MWRARVFMWIVLGLSLSSPRVSAGGDVPECLRWQYHGLRVGMPIEQASRVFPPSAGVSLKPSDYPTRLGYPWKALPGQQVFVHIDNQAAGRPITTITSVRFDEQDSFRDLIEWWGTPDLVVNRKHLVHYVWRDDRCGVEARATYAEELGIVALSGR